MVQFRSISEWLHGPVCLSNLRVELADLAGRREAARHIDSPRTPMKGRHQKGLIGEKLSLFRYWRQVGLKQRVLGVRCCGQSTCEAGAAGLHTVHGG